MAGGGNSSCSSFAGHSTVHLMRNMAEAGTICALLDRAAEPERFCRAPASFPSVALPAPKISRFKSHDLLQENYVAQTSAHPQFSPKLQYSSDVTVHQRCKQGSNLRGKTPLDFKSNSVTTRPSQRKSPRRFPWMLQPSRRHSQSLFFRCHTENRSTPAAPHFSIYCSDIWRNKY